MFTFLKEDLETLDPEIATSRVAAFRYYLIIIASLFFIGGILEIIVDFQTVSLFTFLIPTIVPIIFLSLSYSGVPHRPLLLANLATLMCINEAQILLNPQGFHVMVYWTGLSPLLAAVLLNIRDTIVWTVLVFIFIVLNGIHVTNLHPSYDLTIYPALFTVGGLLFSLMIAMIALLFSYTKYRNHKRVTAQNLKLQSLANEIEEQNKRLKEQHEEITVINSKLEEYNQHLEERVQQRTAELEIKNRGLTEYAFINSHLLRGPLSRILGLLHLLELSELTEKEKEITSHLHEAGRELDEVVARINKAIDSGHTFDRETIRKMKP